MKRYYHTPQTVLSKVSVSRVLLGSGNVDNDGEPYMQGD